MTVIQRLGLTMELRAEGLHNPFISIFVSVSLLQHQSLRPSNLAVLAFNQAHSDCYYPVSLNWPALCSPFSAPLVFSLLREASCNSKVSWAMRVRQLSLRVSLCLSCWQWSERVTCGRGLLKQHQIAALIQSVQGFFSQIARMKKSSRLSSSLAFYLSVFGGTTISGQLSPTTTSLVYTNLRSYFGYSVLRRTLLAGLWLSQCLIIFLRLLLRSVRMASHSLWQFSFIQQLSLIFLILSSLISEQASLQRYLPRTSSISVIFFTKLRLIASSCFTISIILFRLSFTI